MGTSSTGRKADLVNILEDIDAEVKEVYASISEASIRDQQINMMMLSRMHQVCTEEPKKAAVKYNLPPDIVDLIAKSGPNFFLKIQPLADKFMFDMSRNADCLRRALKVDDTLKSRFFQVARMYSADISDDENGNVA